MTRKERIGMYIIIGLVLAILGTEYGSIIVSMVGGFIIGWNIVESCKIK